MITYNISLYSLKEISFFLAFDSNEARRQTLVAPATAPLFRPNFKARASLCEFPIVTDR